MDPIFLHVRNLKLAVRDFAIFGSGPLIVRGIIPAANDLDVVCRGAAWQRASSIGAVEYLEEYDVTIVTICEGRISFGTEWGIGEFDIDSLIDEAELIDGLPFVPLKYVVEYKRKRGSPKDQRHLEALMKSKYAVLI